MNNVFDRIPHTSAELIKALDEQIQIGRLSPSCLSTEEARLELAEDIGKRALVDDLMNALKRQQEEAPNGNG